MLLCGASGELRACYFVGRLESSEPVFVWGVWRAESLLLCGASGDLRACYFVGRLES